ncbi:CITE1 protein, partial [Cinclus mexicanus]|nr:CITE1 protein [Cinclus mexicanus]
VPAVGPPPPPLRPPSGRFHFLASLRLQKLHIQNRASERVRRPTEPGSPLPWGLGTRPRGAGSHRLQAAGPAFVDSDPVDQVLGALVVELDLNRVDELPELWLGQRELDSPSDLPAG